MGLTEERHSDKLAGECSSGRRPSLRLSEQMQQTKQLYLTTYLSKVYFWEEQLYLASQKYFFLCNLFLLLRFFGKIIVNHICILYLK